MRNRLLLLLLLFSLGTIGFSQSSDKPNIIPSSPESEAIKQYGTYPVSSYTGVPNINIPIYEIKSGQLNLPISMSFHASGFKPRAIDGVLGFNWVLNTGGRVSREIRGVADDYYYSYNYTGPVKYNENDLYSIHPHSAYQYLKEIEDDFKDAEYDIFSYSFGQFDGSFIIKPSVVNGYPVYTPVLLNGDHNIKIEIQVETQFHKIDVITITDPNGVVYRFGRSLEGSDAYELVGADTDPQTRRGRTTWLLTDIISPDQVDKISFKYGALDYQQTPQVSGSYIVYDDYKGKNAPGQPEWPGHNAENQGWFSQYYRNRNLTEISFNHGKLVFSYVNRYLNKIELLNVAGARKKEYLFNIIRYGTEDNGHHKLESFTAGEPSQVYRFDYFYEPIISAAVTGVSEDWWGYYNGHSNMGSLLPSMLFPKGTGNIYIGNSLNNRSPNEKMKCLMMQKVHYPTGGNTEYFYGLNRYRDDDGQIKEAGGLRIEKIVNYDGVGYSGKVYKYGANEDGAGTIVVSPHILNLLSYQEYCDAGDYRWTHYNYFDLRRNPDYTDGEYTWIEVPYWGGYRQAIISSQLPQLTHFSAPVYYQIVTEYDLAKHPISGGLEVLTNKVVSEFNEFPWKGNTITPFERYVPFMRKLEGYSFSGLSPHMPAFQKTIGSSHRVGLLKRRVTFQKVGDTFQQLKEEVNNYQTTMLETVASSLKVYRSGVFARMFHEYHVFQVDDPDLNGGPAYGTQYPFPVQVVAPPFTYKDYYFEKSRVALFSTQETLHTPSGPITTTTNFSYANPAHSFPTHINKTSSAGKSEEMSVYRPLDRDYLTLSPEASAAVDMMIEKNMVAPVLQEVQTVSDRDAIGEYRMLAQTIKTTHYKIWDAQNRIIKPKEATSSTYILNGGMGAGDTKINFHGYDERGNLLAISKESDVKTSYLWGYNKTYPVAQVVNADGKDAFHTSFEDGEGNSGDGDSKTGKKSKLGGYSKALSGLTNGTYELSWWQKSGSAWGLNTLKLTVAMGSYTINLTGQVDEVRFYPSKAQMITYTYEPLVGLTSQTDINNRVTYYEYDPIGRLLRIRDENNNILKQFQYQYGEQGQGPVVYYNATQVQNFTPECGMGYSAKPVTYIVPAGKYSAATQLAANQLAWDDVAANGQAYANTHGVCEPAYKNHEVFQNFLKDDCQEGLVGSQVTYTVPAGKYAATTQEAANQLAWDDVASNGQAYANTHGVCGPPIYVRLDMDYINDEMFWTNCGYWGGASYSGAVLRFFSDAECTQPLSVTNLIVNIQVETLNSNTGSNVSQVTYTANGSSLIIENNVETSYDDCTVQRSKWFYLLNGNYIRVN